MSSTPPLEISKRSENGVHGNKAHPDTMLEHNLDEPETSKRVRLHRHADSVSSGRSLAKTIFGIGPRDNDYPASRLIFPYSYFAIAWMAMTGTCLVYTAVVTPAVISFHWLEESCEPVPTLYFDCTLDIFFLLDIFSHFCTGIYFQGQYRDEWKWVAWNYVTSGFVFDLATSVPVSFIEMSILNACKTHSDAIKIDASELRFLRILKPLRLLKLARVMKLKKFSSTITFACDQLGLSPRVQRLCMLAVRIIGLIHLGGCFVWLVKVTSSSREDVSEFLHGIHEDYEAELTSLHGKLSAYVVCTYFVTTIFSTVGFGDISATNPTERIVYSCFMLYGILVFGNLLAELGEVNRIARADESARMERVQAATDFMEGHDVPRVLFQEVIRWTRFHHEHQSSDQKRKEFLESLPAAMHDELVTHMYGETMKKVPLFEVVAEEQPSLLSEVWSLMEYTNVAPDTAIVHWGEPSNRLIVVISGEVELQITKPDGSTVDTATFCEGDFFGDGSLLGDTDWGKSTLIDVPGVELEARTGSQFAVCLVLKAKDFQVILDSNEFHIAGAVEQFKRNRDEHLAHRKEEGFEGGKDFVRTNRILLRWSRSVTKLVKKRRLEGLLDHPDLTGEFAKKISNSIGQKRDETAQIAPSTDVSPLSPGDKEVHLEIDAAPDDQRVDANGAREASSQNSLGKKGELTELTIHEGRAHRICDSERLVRMEQLLSRVLTKVESLENQMTRVMSALDYSGSENVFFYT